MSKNAIDHVLLYDNQVFVNCSCSDKDKVTYPFEDDNRSINKSTDIFNAITTLMWYSPNMHSSSRSISISYLSNPIFENAIITYYLRYLKLLPEDICFIPVSSKKEDKISDKYLKPYLNSVCCNCQKIIITKHENETKPESIARHLRNCIAHGNFSLSEENGFVGFDRIKKNYTAVIKLNSITIYNLFNQVINYQDFTISHIFQYAFLKAHYQVISIVTKGYNYGQEESDEEIVFAIRSNRAFRINCSRYRENKRIEDFKEIDEYVVSFDKQFHKDVSYIDLYYCETEKSIRMLADNRYAIGKNVLESLCKGDNRMLDNIKPNS